MLPFSERIELMFLLLWFPTPAHRIFRRTHFAACLLSRVLQCLAKHMPFEIAAGLNGTFWVDSGASVGS